MSDDYVPLPRFRGRAFKKEKGWTWEIHCSMLNDNKNGWLCCCKEMFETKKLALKDLRKKLSEIFAELKGQIPGMNPDTYIDMKNNEVRPWKEN
jgi:hypothetical protein